MANTILLKRNAVAGTAPGAGSITAGELAYNTADGRLYSKLTSGSITELTIQAYSTANITANATRGNVGWDLTNTGVSSGQFGSGSQIPVVTVDIKGRVTSISTTAVTIGTTNNSNVAYYANIIPVSTNQSYYLTFANSSTASNSTINVNSGITFNPGTSILTTSGNIVTSGNFLSTAATNITANNGAFSYGTLSYSDSNVLASFSSSVNGYNQMILQNVNNGAAASTNFNVSNDRGNATYYYGEFGMNSSQFSGTGPFSSPNNVYLASASSDLVIGTYASNAIKFVVNSGSSESVKIDTNGNLVAASGTISSSVSTGALVVVGGAGVSGALYAGSVYDNGVRVVSTSTGAGNLSITAGGISLPATGGAGTFGSASQVPVFTTDAYGRVTGTTNTSISIGGGQVNGGTVPTANAAIYAQTTAYTTQTFYPTFSNIAGGNTALGVNSGLTFNATSGNLTSPSGLVSTTLWGAVAATTANVSGVSILNGNVVAASGTTSSSTTTGALVVAGSGGLGVGGAIYSTTARITSATDSTSISTGALVIQNGGLGVQGNVWIGGNLYVGNIVATTYSQLQINDPLLYLTANTPQPYIYDIGLYSQFVGGSQNTYGHTGVVRQQSGNAWVFFSNVQSEPSNTINWADPGLIYDAIKSGDHNIANTTVSTSTTSGALTVAGGTGIAGRLNVGGNIVAASGTASVSSTTGALVISGSGGLGVGGVITAGGNIVAASSTASTSTTTGALVVTGGVGISGAIYSGTTITAAGNIVAASGTASVSSTTGALVISGSGGLGVGGVITAGGNIVAASGTVSTGTTSGALVVTGGVGISGRLNVGGNIVAVSTTSAINSTDGALVVLGAIGVGSSLGSGNAIVVNSATNIVDTLNSVYLKDSVTIDGGTY